MSKFSTSKIMHIARNFSELKSGSKKVWELFPGLVSLAATTVVKARPRSLGRREMNRCPTLVAMMSSTTTVLWYYHEAGMASLKHRLVMTRTWLLEGEGSRSQWGFPCVSPPSWPPGGTRWCQCPCCVAMTGPPSMCFFTNTILEYFVHHSHLFVPLY